MHRKLTHLRQQYKHIVNKQRLAQLLFSLQLQISAILRRMTGGNLILLTCTSIPDPVVGVSYQCPEN